MTPLQALAKIKQLNRQRAYISGEEAQAIINALSALPHGLTLSQAEIEGGIDSRILWEWVVENAIRKSFNI